ncbi:unnamed protein product [Symbiodinium sp. KB8]|nr:unnamed protein product [Symbiodinium sp. KB8]
MPVLAHVSEDLVQTWHGLIGRQLREKAARARWAAWAATAKGPNQHATQVMIAAKYTDIGRVSREQAQELHCLSAEFAANLDADNKAASPGAGELRGKAVRDSLDAPCIGNIMGNIDIHVCEPDVAQPGQNHPGRHRLCPRRAEQGVLDGREWIAAQYRKYG